MSEKHLPTLLSQREMVQQTYADLMQSIFLRVDASIDSIEEMRSQPKSAENWKNAKFCYLQCRKICECAALAVLMAHSPYQISPRLKNKYNARLIFTELLQTNVEGLPIPVLFNTVHDPEGMSLITRLEARLDASGLKEIYEACDRRLHIGSFKLILSGKSPKYNADGMISWQVRLTNLLNSRIVRLLKVDAVLLVVLKDSQSLSLKCGFAGKQDGFLFQDGDDVRPLIDLA